MCFCGFYYGVLHLALCSRVALLSIVITSLGEERAGLCAFRAFVCLYCMHKFLSIFALPLGVRD